MGNGHMRVVVRMPNGLVEALDALSRQENRCRSDLIRESVAEYLRRRDRDALREQLIRGYQEWGAVNQALAEAEWDWTDPPRE
ncbi:MAG: ribbon-helix-helix domain-containing protein [Actinomycetia bacterium]|nr:ribbon-helix-helix domain-containing protein [Actinomycetes bacterium]